MKMKPEKFSTIDVKPIISSDSQGWNKIKLSKWDDISPHQAYDTSLDSKHLITIHGSSEPVKINHFENSGVNEGLTKPGDIQIMPSGQNTYCQWEQAISFLKMEITPSYMDEVAYESGLGWTGHIELDHKFLVQDPKLLQLSQWMFEELSNNGASGKLYIDSLANMTIIHLLQHYTTSSQKCLKPKHVTNQQISLVIEYMHAHLEKDISLDEISAVANVSTSHLVRLFKQHTGFTPHQYLIQLRIERSKFLIRCGKMSFKEIAAQVGFSDQGHFTKLFKRTVGLTPMQFANISR
ncbi:helix-turn-helix domain-containing protein [Paenibacillus sp. GCM10012306]|uniref:helix-turn-helix domain-containing protein n=1 Tax=Paenibacillus sp. GCM10012306 TaxID=3317342 RepID=UPI00361B909E